MEIDFSKVVAIGTRLYDGTVPCRVIIQTEEIWPAFYNSEDDPDGPSVDDKVMPCVSVWYESPTGGLSVNAGGGYYRTVEEARNAVEKVLSGPVEWKT